MSEIDVWDVKARRGLGAAKFDADQHPRDRKGRFIETNALVSVWGGGRGTVVKNVGGGRIEVRLQNGSVQQVHRNYLTVMKRPDGSEPTAKAQAATGMAVEQPSKGAREFTPSTPDGRIPIKDLKPGQPVLLYGTRADGETSRQTGIVQAVTPAEGGGWTVRLGGVDDLADPVDVRMDDDDMARLLPEKELTALVDAIRRDDPNAADLARALVAKVTVDDDAEAETSAPSAGGQGGDVEQRIRAMVRELEREPGGWVSLTDLRARLSDVPREQMDEALRSLNRQPDATLVPEDNQKALRPEDRAAALTIGDQPKYYIRLATDDEQRREESAAREMAAFFAAEQASQARQEPVPAAPQTVVPSSLQRGDRVTFDVPVTAANAERFAGPAAKNPPKPGVTVTVRGVVEGVETDMFGGSKVTLRGRGAQWQSPGGGGGLHGDGLAWELDEDHAVHKTGKAGQEQQPRGAVPVSSAPQSGLFSDVGREAQGTEDMFTAHERDQGPRSEPEPAPPAEPAKEEAPDGVPEEAAAPEADSETAATGEERAKALSQQAKEAFEARDYGRAMRLTGEAFEAWPDMPQPTRDRMERNRSVIQSHWRRKGSDEDLAAWAGAQLREQPDTVEVTPLLKDLDRGDRVYLPNPGGRGGREVIITNVPEKVGKGPRARGRISYIGPDGRRGSEARSWNARLTVLRGWEPLPEDDGSAAAPDEGGRLERDLSIRPGLLPRDVEQRLATARGRLVEALSGDDYRAVEQAASDYQRELNAAYQGLPRHMPRRDIAQAEITKTNHAVGAARFEWTHSHNELPDPQTLDMTKLSEAELDELGWRARNSPMGTGVSQQILTMLGDEMSRRRAERERGRDEPTQIDTNRDDPATVSSTMGAPKTGPAPTDDSPAEGEDDGDDDERDRESRAPVLADVPTAGVRGAGESGRALPGPGVSGGGPDRRGGGGSGREGSGRGKLRGSGGQAGERADDRPADGAGRRGVPDARARQGERGTATGVTPTEESFRPSSQEDLAPAGEKAKARANIAAVRTLRALQAEDRPATEEERRILARWSGWGSLPIVFEPRPLAQEQRFRQSDGTPDQAKFERAVKRWKSFAPERAELREMLSDAEWRDAEVNTLNAHYTDAAIVSEVWDAVRELGFNGGNVLEPGSGAGTFIGMAPEGAHMTGVELDPTTAGISQALYPDATVRNESFADTRAPANSFDAVVGNVPFGDYWLVDRDYNPERKHSIHNHFILKSLGLTRPGGLVAVITSRYTMDSEDNSARREMARMGDLVGAVRLPSGAHRKAAGTDVVTDLLIFRKRGEGEPAGDTSWINAPTTDVNGSPHPINAYFQQHPEQILGELTTGRGQFTDHDVVVKGDRDAAPAMREALDRIVADAQKRGATFEQSDEPVERLQLAARHEGHDGALHLNDDGTFSQVKDGRANPANVHPTQVEQLTALLGLRDVARALLAEENSSESDTPRMDELRAELNRRHDDYTRRWGPTSKRANRRFTPKEAKAKADAEGRKVADSEMAATAIGLLRSDPAGAIVFALDDYDPDTDSTRKADIFDHRVVAAKKTITETDDPGEAMAVVIDRFGELRLDEVAKLLGVDGEEEARQRLGNRVYEQPPFYTESGEPYFLPGQRQYVPAADYLSGNVRQKLALAREAAENDPRFALNAAALEEVLPRDLTPGEIDARMGAAWINAATIQEFLRDILNDPSVKVNHAGGSLWEVNGSKDGYEARHTYGTDRKQWSAIEIAESLLRQATIKVTQSTPGGGSVADPAGTIEAQQKAQEMSERFSEWVWEDPDRAERLARVYNDRFNSIVLRSYDGANPALPGLAHGWKPREHQKAAVARIVNEPAVLLAHEVGAGKTAEMVMGAMELRRTGMSRKPAIVVPNHMLEQFTREFLELYPNAKILAAGTKDLEKDKRREFVARAATGDWDAVILTQKAFEKIDMHPDVQRDYRDDELQKLRAAIERAREFGEDSRLLKRLMRQLVQAEEKLKAKLDSKKDEGAVYFEHTGIDYLMVDEAHMYKNLRTPSRIEGAGIDGSGRASDLHMKLHYLRGRSESGRVVTFATGTDIANSVTEAYVMMRYLRPDLLEEAGIDDFDTWAATFGDVITDIELNPDGNGFRQKARFAKFRNVPELLRIYRVFADVKTADDLGLPTPPVRKDANGNRGETAVVPASPEQLEYITDLGHRAEAVRSGNARKWINGVPEEEWDGPIDPDEDRVVEDNMLKISGDGKRAALDMRLLDPGTPQSGGKLEVAAEKIAEIYQHSKDWQYPVRKDDDELHPTPGALQIVFMDQGTPKKKPGKPRGTKVPAEKLKAGQWLNRSGTPTRITGVAWDDERQAFIVSLDSAIGAVDEIIIARGDTLVTVPDPKLGVPDELVDAPAGDGDVSTWAAYDEMKAQLVARGVPENKIRYIHEANTDAQKAKLFEDARTGKIAVLLGSTEKMGTGTNVQARAVALHHMDCPWRPADLAQREGRVERQGNFNQTMHDKDVRIIRYVTEGTFDGYSWQTVERKQKFIAQMKRGTLDVREIEDIGDAALSFAEVKALATGNPYLMDKAKADTELNRLERLDRAHDRNQGNLAQQITRAEQMVQELTADIGEWQEAVAVRVDTRGDNFTIKVGDLETDKRADVYEPLLKAVRDVRDGPAAEDRPVQVGELGGHPIYATKTRRYYGDQLFRVIDVGFDFSGGVSSYRGHQLTDGSGNGMLRALENRLAGLEPQIEAADKRIAHLREQVGKMQGAVGKPFAKAGQLAEARERSRLLGEIIKTQSHLDELKGQPDGDAYKAAVTELALLKGRLDELRPAIMPDPATDPDPDLNVSLDDPTPSVHADDDGFAVADVPDSGEGIGDVSPTSENVEEPEGTSRMGSFDQPTPQPEPEPDEPTTPAPAGAVERATETVEPGNLMPGDRIRVVRTSDGVRRIRTRFGSYLSQSDGRVWEGTIPDGYQPGQPVRLADVIEFEGDQPARYVPEPGPVRLTEPVDRLGTADAATSTDEAARLRDSRAETRQTNMDEQAERRRHMLDEAGGPALVDAVTTFDAIAEAAENGEVPAADAEIAWVRADAALAAAQDGDLDWIRAAQIKTLRQTLADRLVMLGGDPRAAHRRAAEWEQARQEAERAADDGIPEAAPVEDVSVGDRVDTPDGSETVTVEEVTRAGGLTITTERGEDDGRTIRARREGEQVTKRTRPHRQPEIGPAAASDVVVGEWLINDDGHASKIVGIERDGDRIAFDLLDPDGRPMLIEADAGETVTRGRGLRAKRKRTPKPPSERKPRSTITSLPDGTPATRVRLRSDIRKRVLALAIEDDENASEQARTAAARLRASQPVSAEQMRTLGQRLRALAGGDMPAVQRRSLERAASWVDGSYARLVGYPAPPHEPHRAAPEKANPENLTAGDVIAIPDQAGGPAVTVRVVDAKPVARFPFVTVTVEHDDGRREQRILAAGVDVFLMPDLPADVEPAPAPERRREHITPDRVQPGDTIRVAGTDRKVVSLWKTSGEFDPVEEWAVIAEGGDGGELTLTSRGFPSVLRVGRGEPSTDQSWEAVLDDSGEGRVDPGAVRLGDRISVDAAHGGAAGTVEQLSPLAGPDGTQIGTTALVRTYADDMATVAMLDDDATLQVTRHANGGDNAELRIARQQARRRKVARVRAVRQALGEAELDLYRSAAAAISDELGMRRVHPPEAGDRAWLRSPDLVEDAWKRLDQQAPALQAARALAGGDGAHAAALANRLAPLVAQIHERAAANLTQSILEVDPLPGETHDQALARMLEQFRTDPPTTVDIPLARRLDVEALFGPTDEAPAGLPAVQGSLPERLAAYRQALPANLGEVGHRQVTRTVYKPLDLSDLEDGYDPEIEQITVTVPDVADDDGPGEHAMRHLAVIKAAGAEVDQAFTSRLATPAYQSAVAVAEAAEKAMWDAERALAKAEHEASQHAFVNNLSEPSPAHQKAFDKAAREARKARKAVETAKLRVAELRREAVLEVLREVRSFGGARLTYQTKTGQARKESHKPVQAMRRVEDVYPADWVAMLGDEGPVGLAIAQPNIMGGPGRAGYSPKAHTIVMPDSTPQEQFRQGVHELGHAFQHRLPGLREAERAFLWERTASGDVGHRERGEPVEVGVGPGEVGYDGGFPHPYTGRVYAHGGGEVFTTGMESLMAGADYLDDDMRSWLLGVLSLLGTSHDGPTKDPLDGVDLEELSVDQLQALLGQVEWNSPAYERIMAQLRGRHIEGDPLDGVDLEELSAEDLADLLGSLSDNFSAARISEVLDRRHAEDEAERRLNAQIDALVASGEMDQEEAWAHVHGLTVEQMEAERRRASVDERLPGESVERRVRRQYDEWVEHQYGQAEAATNGYMVNKRGRAAGVDPKSLFSGDWRRVNAYASDELYNWFRANGWRNYTEYVADVLGRDRDVRAARRSRESRRFTR
ncbi:helicase-related protein [Nonomuraea dietziae]|uniref:helicase-related protein n=1 Tax=Nonomuraea dietziae TaxID=65515 RepID=UPI0033EC48E1